jgi:hypothetical protein
MERASRVKKPSKSAAALEALRAAKSGKKPTIVDEEEEEYEEVSELVDEDAERDISALDSEGGSKAGKRKHAGASHSLEHEMIS